jgi:cytochrome c peroxidase
MKSKHRLVPAAIAAALAYGLVLAPSGATAADPDELTLEEQLGSNIFFDKQLSIRRNQACATCHVPEAGWVGDDPKINEAGAVYEGSIKGKFGNRKPPSSAYATVSPIFDADFSEDPENPLFFGGNFWDGRATGWKLGNPAADQAQGPFLNPVEQALPDNACVVYRVCEGNYGDLAVDVWGTDACDINWPGMGVVNQQCVKPDGEVPLSPGAREKVDAAYDLIALAVAAFEDSPVSNAFTSKLDAVRAEVPGVEFTEQELLGREVFRGKGLCSACHVGSPPGDPEPPLLTDFTYDNLGVPKNPENPATIADPEWADPGLAGFLETVPEYAMYADANLGKHKVPTLRNVGLGSCEAQEFAGLPPKNCITKAYMHNGYFKTLAQVVNFYNTRDVKPSCESLEPPIYDATVEVAMANGCWPPPEVGGDTVNTDELGDLGLTPEEEAALVAFMMAMSDGYDPDAGF